MCGIVAYSGKDVVDKDNFKILMLYSQQRGDEASGFATGKSLIKDTDKSAFLIAKNQIPDSNLIIGHTRNPSVSTKRDIQNAQPFMYENIVAAHNGYISNHYQLRQRLNTSYDLSDSYHALRLIDSVGIEEAIKTIEGNYAFLWIDKKEDTLNLIRNSRPTYLGQKDGGLYVASDEDYLKAIDCDNITETKSEHLYVIKDGMIKNHRKLEVYKHSYSNRNSRFSHSPYYGYGYSQDTHKERKKDLENAFKLDSKEAPDDAKSVWIQGHKHYYWLENDKLMIEELKHFNDVELHTFDLDNTKQMKVAYRQFQPIVVAITDHVE